MIIPFIFGFAALCFCITIVAANLKEDWRKPLATGIGFLLGGIIARVFS